MVAGVITGLQPRWECLAGLRIARAQGRIEDGIAVFHLRLRRSRLASTPSIPAAPKSRGAKIGGPYMML